MRKIVLDTETTGLSHQLDDRVVEIGCLELIDDRPTGAIYQQYINPERDMPPEAFAVHGLSAEFLAAYPIFADCVDEFLAFIGDSPLIIHNATFDINFLNSELMKVGYPPLDKARAINTVTMARRKFPGSPTGLDALCQRFKIDTSSREKHGALLDCQLLAQVHGELIDRPIG